MAGWINPPKCRPSQNLVKRPKRPDSIHRLVCKADIILETFPVHLGEIDKIEI